MGRKIGEIFEFGGEWYQCVNQNGCCNCAFYNTPCHLIDELSCNSLNKKRKEKYIFKKLEKVGEPYEFDGHLFQSYYTLAVPIFTENYATVRELGNNSKISIEIKQNKEDMEDLDKIKVRDYTKVEELNVMEENKLNLKPFDIQKAKEGKPVCTRDGHKARIICFDYNGETGDYPIVALVHYNKGNKCYERVLKYTSDGLFNKYRYCQHDDDLMMLPEKKEGWANIYRSQTYNTPEEAKEAYKRTNNDDNYLKTIKIEWYE